MANELVINASLTYNKNSVSILEQVNTLRASVAGNGLNSLSAFTVTTSAIAIPLVSISSPGGWIFIQNNDPTNYITLLTGTAGTVFARLLPGEFALFRYDPSVTAPAAQAHTAGCSANFCVFDL